MRPSTRVLPVIGVACLVGLSATVGRTKTERPVEVVVGRPAADIEPHWQLFLDDHVIERSTGFRRVVHSPKPRGVVLEPDQPWETQGLSIMHVGRRRDGKFECYYRVHGEGVRAHHLKEGTGTTIVDEEMPKGEAITLPMEKGSVLLMHKEIPHRSTPNVTETVRRKS